MLDPVVTSIVSTVHGYHVFDTLYGVDDRFRARPQMAEGHTVEDEGLTWTIRLRDGLKWHDGEPVLARDCIASLKLWSQRDVFGRLLAHAVEAWETVDDRNLRIRLKQPFGVLPDALAHPQASAAFMMPERIATIPASTQIREMIGSGPLRFLKDEYQPGNHVAYARFDGYVPRDEPAQGTAGGKRVYFDRIEWKIILDDATAAGALQTGEVDWWELINPDYVSTMQKDQRPAGRNLGPVRAQHVHAVQHDGAAVDNVKLRRVILSAVDQAQFMPAVAGDVPGAWKTCYSLFACGVPGVHQIGEPLMSGPKDFAKPREAVKASGYAGEKIVLISAADYSLTAGLGPIAVDLLSKLGLNVDFQQMDFTTWMQRRTSRATVDKGGWSVFMTQGASAVTGNPGLMSLPRGMAVPDMPAGTTIPKSSLSPANGLLAPAKANAPP